VQVPASQQAPAAHVEGPLHCTLQVVPPHRTGPVHEPIPEHVMVFVMLPPATTPPGQADRPAHVTLQSVAVQFTPAVHEVAPQETVQLDPPQATLPQLDEAVQSMLHEVAEEQSTATLALPVTSTSHGTPEGHVHVGADPMPQVMEHVPLVQVPASQAATQAALVLDWASASPGAPLSVVAVDASPPSVCGAATSLVLVSRASALPASGPASAALLPSTTSRALLPSTAPFPSIVPLPLPSTPWCPCEDESRTEASSEGFGAVPDPESPHASAPPQVSTTSDAIPNALGRVMIPTRT
jgi:hypothetical protein